MAVRQEDGAAMPVGLVHQRWVCLQSQHHPCGGFLPRLNFYACAGTSTATPAQGACLPVLGHLKRARGSTHVLAISLRPGGTSASFAAALWGWVGGWVGVG